MVTDSSHARRSRRFSLGALALLSTLSAVLVAAPTAQAAMLTNVGPRLPTNIGPRGPMIDSLGPRYDPTLHTGGNGQGSGNGGNTSNNSNAGSSSGGGGNNSSSGGGSKNTKRVVRTPSGVPPGNERRYILDHVVFELVGNQTQRQVTNFLNRYRLELIGQHRIGLLNTTVYNARITDGSSVPTKIRAMEAGGAGRVQPEYLFVTVADQAPATDEQPDAAQYAVGKLHLDEAHTLARGDNVLVAVVDSGIDVDHPALAGVVEKTFDALNS